MIAVIDYGAGNLFSLCSSLKSLGLAAQVTHSAADLQQASHLILPGVGAFGDAMQKLTATGLVPDICAQAQAGKPLLGICLGMQLLFDTSYEYGTHAGLHLLQGEICPLEDDLRAAGYAYKVPHMGWNALQIKQPQNALLRNTKMGDSVYFVHSFYAKNCAESIVATSEYGIDVPAVVAKNNVYGCQFHPEKSGRAGLAILSAFAQI
ncbi:MAG: imidazole glycerol phosphate synthase subunit HisH [Ruthenibacterium sp.]